LTVESEISIAARWWPK